MVQRNYWARVFQRAEQEALGRLPVMQTRAQAISGGIVWLAGVLALFFCLGPEGQQASKEEVLAWCAGGLMMMLLYMVLLVWFLLKAPAMIDAELRSERDAIASDQPMEPLVSILPAVVQGDTRAILLPIANEGPPVSVVARLLRISQERRFIPDPNGVRLLVTHDGARKNTMSPGESLQINVAVVGDSGGQIAISTESGVLRIERGVIASPSSRGKLSFDIELESYTAAGVRALGGTFRVSVLVDEDGLPVLALPMEKIDHPTRQSIS